MKSLKERIAVEQAAWDGGEIESHRMSWQKNEWSEMFEAKEHLFNWQEFDYRVKPKPLEFWVIICNNAPSTVWDTKEEAKVVADKHNLKTIKVREVTDD